jgi:hypothetical protein
MKPIPLRADPAALVTRNVNALVRDLAFPRRNEAGNAFERNVGIIRSPMRASILPDSH